jgi:hypothetical protein
MEGLSDVEAVIRPARLLIALVLFLTGAGLIAAALVVAFHGYASATRFEGLRTRTITQLRYAVFSPRLAGRWHWRGVWPGREIRKADVTIAGDNTITFRLTPTEDIQLPQCSGILSSDGSFDIGPILAKIGSLRFDAIVGRVRGPALVDGQPQIWLEAQTVLKRRPVFAGRVRLYRWSGTLAATGRT